MNRPTSSMSSMSSRSNRIAVTTRVIRKGTDPVSRLESSANTSGNLRDNNIGSRKEEQPLNQNSTRQQDYRGPGFGNNVSSAYQQGSMFRQNHHDIGFQQQNSGFDEHKHRSMHRQDYDDTGLGQRNELSSEPRNGSLHRHDNHNLGFEPRNDIERETQNSGPFNDRNGFGNQQDRHDIGFKPRSNASPEYRRGSPNREDSRGSGFVAQNDYSSSQGHGSMNKQDRHDTGYKPRSNDYSGERRDFQLPVDSEEDNEVTQVDDSRFVYNSTYLHVLKTAKKLPLLEMARMRHALGELWIDYKKPDNVPESVIKKTESSSNNGTSNGGSISSSNISRPESSSSSVKSYDSSRLKNSSDVKTPPNERKSSSNEKIYDKTCTLQSESKKQAYVRQDNEMTEQCGTPGSFGNTHFGSSSSSLNSVHNPFMNSTLSYKRKSPISHDVKYSGYSVKGFYNEHQNDRNSSWEDTFYNDYDEPHNEQQPQQVPSTHVEVVPKPNKNCHSVSDHTKSFPLSRMESHGPTAFVPITNDAKAEIAVGKQSEKLVNEKIKGDVVHGSTDVPSDKNGGDQTALDAAKHDPKFLKIATNSVSTNTESINTTTETQTPEEWFTSQVDFRRNTTNQNSKIRELELELDSAWKHVNSKTQDLREMTQSFEDVSQKFGKKSNELIETKQLYEEKKQELTFARKTITQQAAAISESGVALTKANFKIEKKEEEIEEMDKKLKDANQTIADLMHKLKKVEELFK